MAVRQSKKKKRSTKNKPGRGTYDALKFFGEKQYTGMKVGGHHKWYYDKGVWQEKKIHPDCWEIHYAVTKRRAGKAPTGSGAAVGTGYHWYIMANQLVSKLNADDYTTVLSGLKFKLAHKRAAKGSWSASAAARRKELVNFLKGMIRQLENKPIPLQFNYDETEFKGEAMPILPSFHDGLYYDYDILLNGAPFGILHRLKNNWKIEGAEDNRLVKMIGEIIDTTT
ncbi:MAG TPA: hypothetical protein VGO58_05690 [Chitinophagaceae bacterium]|jgi:hypothetical protein|nr:hypothetical protein [Chitinophagaceae bacterium]